MHDRLSPPRITPADISLPPTITFDLTYLVADTQRFGSSPGAEHDEGPVSPLTYFERA